MNTNTNGCQIFLRHAFLLATLLYEATNVMPYVIVSQLFRLLVQLGSVPAWCVLLIGASFNYTKHLK